MKSKRNWAMVAGILAASFAGGAFSHWILSPNIAQAQDAVATSKAIRTQIVSANALIAGSLMITNGENRSSIMLGSEGIAMHDEKGKLRISLDLDKRGPMIHLHDENGMPRAGLSLIDGQPTLSLSDENNIRRVFLSTVKDRAMLLLMDEKGKRRAGVSVTKDESGMGLNDENEKVRVELNMSKIPGLTLYDAKGTNRASMWMFMGNPVVNLSDEKGKVIWLAPQ